MTVSIRVATRAGDARRLAELHVASWRAAYAGILPRHALRAMSVSRLELDWQRSLSRRRSAPAYLMEEDGESVGFATAALWPRDRSLFGLAGEVQMLYLAPSHIGRGLGRALFAHTLDALARSGRYWVIVWVLALNRKARDFYEQAGLRPDGATRVDWFGAQPFRVLRYAAALNPVVDFGALAREASAADTDD